MARASLMLFIWFTILGDITFDDFSKVARCGIRGSVASIQEVSPEELLKEYGTAKDFPLFSSRVTIKIEEILESSDCKDLTGIGSVEVLFSDEVHSSHPRLNEEAVLFLQKKGTAWLEVPYGRGYWPLVNEKDSWMVVINWRNDFLILPLHLESGEEARAPLNAIIRALERQRKITDVTTLQKETD